MILNGLLTANPHLNNEDNKIQQYVRLRNRPKIIRQLGIGALCFNAFD